MSRTVEGYGKPMVCPRCPKTRIFDSEEKVYVKGYFGWLKLPGLRQPKCPNCEVALVDPHAH